MDEKLQEIDLRLEAEESKIGDLEDRQQFYRSKAEDCERVIVRLDPPDQKEETRLRGLINQYKAEVLKASLEIDRRKNLADEIGREYREYKTSGPPSEDGPEFPRPKMKKPRM